MQGTPLPRANKPDGPRSNDHHEVRWPDPRKVPLIRIQAALHDPSPRNSVTEPPA